MKLHYQLLVAESDALPVALIHGLFGNLDNLGVLARELNQHCKVIKVDLRNHELSPRSEEMTYPAMALTAIAPHRVDKLVVIDVAPVHYRTRRHDEIFAALEAVNAAGITQRQQAAQLMRHSLREDIVRQFPQARAHVVAGTGHWVHAEKPEIVLRVLHRFLDQA